MCSQMTASSAVHAAAGRYDRADPQMTGLLQALVWTVERIIARPRLVVVVAVLLAGVALVTTVRHLRIDSSTLEMISAEVPFRRNLAAFTQAFPAFDDPIVAVIEGNAPEQVDEAAATLADALRADPDHFTAVSYPPGEPFLIQNGLLFLDVDELADLTDRLAAAQPLLAALADDPSLRGLVSFLELALEHGDGEADPEIDRLLATMARVVQVQAAGEVGQLSWQRALEGHAEPTTARAIVMAEPRFERGSLRPAATAIAALRAEAASIGID